MVREQRLAIDEESLARAVGRPIFSADAHRLGTIIEVNDSFLKVDAPRQRDYWLNAEYLVRLDDEQATVSFKRRELPAYRLMEPGRPRAEEDTTTVAPGSALSPEEQLEQRRRMALELAQQRESLPHQHREGEESPPDTAGAMGTVGEPVEEELARLGVEPPAPDHNQEETPLTGESVTSPTGAVVPSMEERGGRPVPHERFRRGPSLALLAALAAVGFVAGLLLPRRR